MTAVDVGVGQQDDLVVTNLGHVEVGLDAGADRRDQRLDLGVLQDFVRAGLLDVQDLAANRQDRLDARVARVLGRSPGRVAFDDEELALARLVRRAVDELARQAGAVEGALSTREVARLTRRLTRARGLHRLGDDLAALFGVLFEPVGELLVGRALHQRTDRDVAELALGLTFELGFGQAHRHDGRQSLADVLAGQVLVLLLQQVALARVAVDHVGDGLAEPLFVHAALDRRDAVRERVDALVVAGVPLEGDFDLLAGFGLLVEADLAKEGLLGVVQVAHVVDDAAVVLVRLFRLTSGALVDEADLETAIQERHDLQTFGDRLRAKLDVVEDRRVGREGDRRAGATARCRPGDLQLALRLAAVLEGHLIVVAVEVDLEDQFGRERVDDRDADAVEAARHLVAPAAELPAGVQRREHDLGGRFARVLGVLVDGNAAAVVADASSCRWRGSSRRFAWHAPAMASSTELSTSSRMRWCSPEGPVEPMYMPGRTLTGSRPSRTVMSLAVVVAVRSLGLLGHEGLPFSTELVAHFARSKTIFRLFYPTREAVTLGPSRAVFDHLFDRFLGLREHRSKRLRRACSER